MTPRIGPSGPVTVTVPATSANLGPGFDSLGLALELRDTLTAEVVDGPLVIEVTGEGAADVPLDERHLVHRSMVAAFDRMGTETPAVHLRCTNVIPHARGLGSSSAAIVGGIVLARALVDPATAASFDDAAVLDLANEIEGHPDNVAPALYGGFTIAVMTDDGLVCARPRVHPDLVAIANIPPNPVETSVARGLLPAQVDHAAAAANSGRAALLVHALSDDPDLLLPASEDFLHQRFREPAMPGSLALIDDLRRSGIAAFVSGAGPTVLALASGPSFLMPAPPEGWRQLPLAISADGARVESGPRSD